MKIYNWIDSLLDTKEKRRHVLTIVCLLYLFWQNLWQMLLFAHLFQIKNYDSLFTFLPSMKGYTSSFMIRLLYEWIQSASADALGCIQSFFQAMTIEDGLFFIGILLLMISSNHKKGKRLIVSHILLIVWMLLCIVIGMNATSLANVIHILYTFSFGGIILEIVCIYSILDTIRETFIFFFRI